MTVVAPLRERRRSETRREIHRAAVDLALERGLAQVTVDDIADAAGVSPRTFFNYFRTKPEALVLGPPPLQEASVERFVRAGGDRLLDDLRDLLVEYAELSRRERHELQRVHAVVLANPELSPLLQERFLAFENVIAEAVARRIGRTPPAFEASVIAAVATGVLRATVRDWRDSDTEASLSDRLAEAFGTVRQLL
ncbi:MAG: TetR/AcrR family transcriptional regulator [Natronosporangium sp.]